jgi:hypothetical protein
MAPDAARVVDYLRPLHAVGARCLRLKHGNEVGIYQRQPRAVSTIPVREWSQCNNFRRRI